MPEQGRYSGVKQIVKKNQGHHPQSRLYDNFFQIILLSIIVWVGF